MNLPPIEERLTKLLSLAAYDIRPCKACGATLYFVGTRYRQSRALHV
jgi:hypothetical protein